ncbi:hypothetical protein [Sphingomonas jatrophae]|uniref:Uncharacterized protein n=1 Tax=Sphingomonas jatrophae TaxID=1166337 RepID=A0A1I6JTX2_9SPHN|nr:hypothetical protein [Sphingomonas jatrophae]SFR81970.1 hypothetical protein SAMN05192580_0792 [Sphingomonas jatrophae]
MKRSRARLAAAGALLALAAAAVAQQQAPESLLPPGFGDPVPPPSQSQPPASVPSGDTPVLPLNTPPSAATLAADDAALARELGIEPEAEEAEPELTPEEEALLNYDLPEHARRPADHVGLFSGPPGLGYAAFGRADGRFLATLMRRMDAPLASRWASILLRRALLTDAPTPRGVSAPDWVAERAWLLLRMGEADAARMLVDRMDIDRQSPKLLAVTAQVALANGDPAALCPLVDKGEAASTEPLWPMARGMCAALSGEGGTAAALLDRVRAKRIARGIDLLLAEKVAGASSGRRSVNIEWTGVDKLTSWRFGLATATGVAIPAALIDGSGPHVLAWSARSPMIAPEVRLPAMRAAAAMGVVSNAGLVDLYGLIADRTDPTAIQDSPAGRLRVAYAGADGDARIGALRDLWKAEEPRDRYAGLILTARAAARVAPSDDYGDDASTLIAAMLTAGLDRAAARWSSIAAGRGDGEDGWALLVVGAPAPVDVASDRALAWAGAQSGERAAKGPLLIAALAGLDRLNPAQAATAAQEAGFTLGVTDRWGKALEAAVRAGQTGTVALLAAAALQTSDWRGVPPGHFYQLIAALRRVGLEGEARMIAAEAITRA